MKTDYICTLDAGGWQLYSETKGVGKVARSLSAKLTTRVKKAKARLKKEPALSERKLAAEIRDDMYGHMSKVSDFGARDSEPECVLVAELESAFDLDQYSLER
jgi:hypothetical protein